MNRRCCSPQTHCLCHLLCCLLANIDAYTEEDDEAEAQDQQGDGDGDTCWTDGRNLGCLKDTHVLWRCEVLFGAGASWHDHGCLGEVRWELQSSDLKISVTVDNLVAMAKE